MGARLMASGRSPSMLRISTRLTTGANVGLTVGEAVGSAVRVTVAVAVSGRTVAVCVSLGRLVADGIGTGVTGAAPGVQAFNRKTNSVRKEKNRPLRNIFMEKFLNLLFYPGMAIFIYKRKCCMGASLKKHIQIARTLANRLFALQVELYLEKLPG